jgi:hypothetical protein
MAMKVEEKERLAALLKWREEVKGKFHRGLPWPERTASDYQGGLDLVMYMWGQDRAYNMPDLATLSRARFELSRKRRLPQQVFGHMWQVEKRWRALETSRAMSESQGKDPAGILATFMDRAKREPTAAELDTLAALQAENDARMTGYARQYTDAAGGE